jgi:DNA polymerase III epsilon subunit-like protein
MTSVMLDLETMGNSPNAAIIAIGAVEFDPESHTIGKKFYTIIDLASSVDAGGIIDADTVLWWLKQSDEARAALTDGITTSIVQALQQFQKWCASLGNKKDLIVWGNGANFDNVILKSAFDRLEMAVPWHYWNDRCYRTVKSLNPDIPLQPFGIKHTAISDAENQAVHLMAMLN